MFQYPKNPSQDYIKRCIGRGGETVEVRDKQVSVDGHPLVEPYVIDFYQEWYDAPIEPAYAYNSRMAPDRGT